MSTCPECRNGKHANCDSTSWDEDADEPRHCDCWMNNHERPMEAVT